MKCKICGSVSQELFKTKILGKYDVQFYECPNCAFLQTENEYWFKEAYESSMNLSDTGVLTRSIILAIKTSLIINFFLGKKNKYIDYGGGWGIFTRLMRDIGFNFYWYDPYTKNEVSRGFEADLNKKYTALTIFEGFEHFRNPLEDIEKMFKLLDTIIFSTTLIPRPTPKPEEWDYYGREHGQHIAFYSQETLKCLAGKYKCNYYTDNKYFHILTKHRFPQFLFNVLMTPIGILLFPIVLLVNNSKTLSDHKYLINKK